jgi:hypothetical protein
MNHMTERDWQHATAHMLEGHDVRFVIQGRSVWIRPLSGGYGEVRKVFHTYCVTCNDPKPEIELGSPIYGDELTRWKGHTSCAFKPEFTSGPIGMFHCPDCGAMVLAGYAHPDDESVREQGLEPFTEAPP